MATVKESLDSIEAAVKAGDEKTLDGFAMDERVTVSKAAQKALDKIDGMPEPGEDSGAEAGRDSARRHGRHRGPGAERRWRGPDSLCQGIHATTPDER